MQVDIVFGPEDLAKIIIDVIGVIVFGGAIAYIAWRQYKNDHNRLQMELFDRRLELIKRMNLIINNVFIVKDDQRNPLEFQIELLSLRYDMLYLFNDKKIDNYIEQVSDIVLDIRSSVLGLVTKKTGSKERLEAFAVIVEKLPSLIGVASKCSSIFFDHMNLTGRPMATFDIGFLSENEFKKIIERIDNEKFKSTAEKFKAVFHPPPPESPSE